MRAAVDRGSQLPADEGDADAFPSDAERGGTAKVTRVGFAPIMRVDTERREIELCATSEAVDTYGTIFSYEASRDAFARWAGNVREMHERRAVGRRVAVRADDGERRVYVRVRISRGAEDTWQTVLDGTLRGASIGASNVEWENQRREVGGRSREVPVARRYDLVELSLVDLPSNPDAQGVTFVRDGVPVAEVLDELEGEAAPRAGTGQSEVRHQGTAPAAEMEAFAEGIEERIAREALARAGLAGRAAAPVGEGTEAHDRGHRGHEGHEGPGGTNERETTETEVRAGGRERGPEGPAHEASSVAAGRAPALQRRERLPDRALAAERWEGEAQPARAARLAALGAPRYVQLSLPFAEEGQANGHTHPEPAAERIARGDDERALGAYSNNPDGPPDTGVPERAEERPTAAAYGQTPDGNREAVFHAAARSILLGCGCPGCRAALVALEEDDARGGEVAPPEDDTGRVAAALVTRTVERHARRLEASIRAVEGGIGQLAGTLGAIERRVAVIEAQPMPGGPQLRVADKTHALQPQGGQAGATEQYRALEALAGRLTDPQAQLAVATEMIRLQQEAAGLPPALQVMPRAGSGAR